MREAAAAGASLGLPEMFAFLRREGGAFPYAEAIDGEILGRVRGWARSCACASWPAPSPSASRGRASTTPALLLSPEGEVEAVYRKIHLFDVDLGEAAPLPRVRARSRRREAVVVADTRGRHRPLDLLRPALPRALPRAARPAARCSRVPAAFTRTPARTTGTCCCAPAPSRTRPTCSRPAQCGRHIAGARQPRALADRRSMGPGAGPARRPPGRRGRRLRPRRAGPHPRRACPPCTTGACECAGGPLGRRPSQGSRRPAETPGPGGSPMAGAVLVILQRGIRGDALSAHRRGDAHRPQPDHRRDAARREHQPRARPDPASIADSDTYTIEDLQSTNGTKVNGKGVRSQALAPGDEIQIGHTVFRFECGA